MLINLLSTRDTEWNKDWVSPLKILILKGGITYAMTDRKKQDEHKGYEQGAIRPSNESYSLLLRLTRNCPWNRCTFCPVYKKRQFSLRSVENIIKDIDLIHTYIEAVKKENAQPIAMDQERIHSLYCSFDVRDRVAFNSAIQWYATGMTSVFLQDSDALVMGQQDLLTILSHLKSCFPEIQTISSYARSSTILKIAPEGLEKMCKLGLNRLHVGLESGSDLVLNRSRKGIDRAGHIAAGHRVKKAGIELTEYVMPGLGGIDLSIEHALETAEALNAINPDVIKIRTLVMAPDTELSLWQSKGMYEKPGDAMIATELRLLLESLDNIQSRVKSDHIVNLFESLCGTLPRDKEKLIAIIDRFFDLPEEDRILYQVGRRMGIFKSPEEMDEAPQPQMDQVRLACENYGITPKNVDQVLDRLMMRFV